MLSGLAAGAPRARRTMANPVRQIVTGTAPFNGTPVNMDWFQSPFDATLQVVLPTGATATYTVQTTNDDINDSTITAIWIDDATLAGLSASGQRVLTSPCRWVRCNCAALGGSPKQVQFYVTQGMSSR
jgi:hypothetical protein